LLGYWVAVSVSKAGLTAEERGGGGGVSVVVEGAVDSTRRSDEELVGRQCSEREREREREREKEREREQ
jgi:hypothetical protein